MIPMKHSVRTPKDKNASVAKILRSDVSPEKEKPSALSSEILSHPDKENGPDTQNAMEKPPRKAMNGTAYRIFILLRELMSRPLGIEDINRLFRADPRIGKPVSGDSACFYMNTLRAVGCRIRRPGARNGFRYELLSHPFGLALAAIPLEALARTKAMAQGKWSHQDMLLLDRLLKKVIAYSGVENPERIAEEWFCRSRSLDYDGRTGHLQAMEQWIAEKRLLRLQYLSPLKGEEVFLFLPDALFYRQGAVYLHGERPEFSGPSGLRMDRILSASPVDEANLKAGLESRRDTRIHVVAHILAEFPEAFRGFDLGEHLEVYEARYIWTGEHPAHPYYEAHWQVRDYFYLKQQLLSCGLPFRIIAPTDFREEMRETLTAMQAYYTDD